MNYKLAEEYNLNNYPHMERYLEYLFLTTEEHRSKHSDKNYLVYFSNETLKNVSTIDEAKEAKTIYRNIIRENKFTYDMLHSTICYINNYDEDVLKKLIGFVNYLNTNFDYIGFCTMITHLHENKTSPHIHFIYVCNQKNKFIEIFKSYFKFKR